MAQTTSRGQLPLGGGGRLHKSQGGPWRRKVARLISGVADPAQDIILISLYFTRERPTLVLRGFRRPQALKAAESEPLLDSVSVADILHNLGVPRQPALPQDQTIPLPVTTLFEPRSRITVLPRKRGRPFFSTNA